MMKNNYMALQIILALMLAFTLQAETTGVVPVVNQMNFEPDSKISTAIQWDDGSGLSWVVNGYFDDFQGVPRQRLGRWNGYSWIGVGQFIDNEEVEIRQMVTDENGDLIIVGEFTHLNGKELNHIARWDGRQWHAYGTGFNDRVTAIDINDQGMIFVAGDFDQAIGSSLELNHLAFWDGIQWNPMGQGTSEEDNINQIMGDGLSGIYIQGSFEDLDGRPIAKSAHWDGVNWTSIDPAHNPDLIDMSVDNLHHLNYIDDQHQVVSWDGQSHTPLVNGLVGEPISVVFNPQTETTVTLGYLELLDENRCYVQQWNGLEWLKTYNFLCNDNSRLHMSESGQLAVSGRLLASGQSSGAFFKVQNSYNQFVGLGQGLPGAASESSWGRINTVHLANDGSLWVGGELDLIHQTRINNIGYWTGSDWVAAGTGLNGKVNEITSGYGQIYASTGFIIHDIEVHQYTGSEWVLIADGINNEIHDLQVMDDGSLLVAGRFDQIDGVNANRMARWDGESWQNFGNWVDSGSVNQVFQTSDGSLYAVGFEKQGDLSLTRVMVFTDGQWSTMGQAMNGEINTITLDHQQRLVIAGSINHNNAQTNVMYWNDTQWQALGSNPDAFIGAWGVSSLITTENGDLVLASDKFVVKFNQENNIWEKLFTADQDIYDLAEGTNGALVWVGKFSRVEQQRANYIMSHQSGIKLGLSIDQIYPESINVNGEIDSYRVTVLMSGTSIPSDGLLTVRDELNGSCSIDQWQLLNQELARASCILSLDSLLTHRLTVNYSGNRSNNQVWFKTTSSVYTLISTDLIFSNGFEVSEAIW